MFKAMSLLLVAALVSHQCFLPATARQIYDMKYLNSLRRNPSHQANRSGRPPIYLRMDTTPPTTVEHIPGDVTILECAVSGHPMPTIFWTKNGEPIPDVAENDIDIVSSDKHNVGQTVAKLVLTAPSDGDVFTCVAAGGPNKMTASTAVSTTSEVENTDVLAQLMDMPVAPVITLYYDAIFQEMKTSLVLPCRVSSLAKSQVYWRHELHPSVYNNPHYKVLPSGDLFIPKLNWTDLGEYRCSAKNMFGEDSVATFVYPVKPMAKA